MLDYTRPIKVNLHSEAARTIRLKNTIREDCNVYNKLKNIDAMFDTCLCLSPGIDGEITGLYELILNGKELWYGTLGEINAIVKSMLALLIAPEKFDPSERVFPPETYQPSGTEVPAVLRDHL